VTSPNLLPDIPFPLAEASAAALEWPRLREYIAGKTFSPLGRAWITALEPTSDLIWIERQQQRTAELRAMLTAGGTFEFHGMFDPTVLLDKARIEGSALEALEIAALLVVVERVAAWRNLLGSAEAARGHGLANAVSIRALSAPLLEYDLAPLLRVLRGKIEPDGSLSDDASPELRRIRKAMERQHRAIEESLRRSLRSLSEGGSTQEDLITVRGERFVILRVADHGRGIAREHMPRLSERFYRVEGQKSGERFGTGLGLAIVKHIINRHRGGLAIESLEGQGATFTAYLPQL